MENSALLWLLTMQTTLLCSLVVFAVVAWRRGSRSTRSAKQPTTPPVTPTSDAVLAQMQADQAALFSTLEKLTTTVKRVSSRAGMRDLREREHAAPEAPPVGASKAELLRHYGMSGKIGPAFAQAQLELETSRAETERPN